MKSANETGARVLVAQAVRHRGGNAVTLGAADWLSLAAAPTFTIMTQLTGVLGGVPRNIRSMTQLPEWPIRSTPILRHVTA